MSVAVLSPSSRALVPTGGSLHASMAAARGAPQRQGGRRDAAGLLGLAFAAAFRRHPRRHRRRRRDFRPFALCKVKQAQVGSSRNRFAKRLLSARERWSLTRLDFWIALDFRKLCKGP